MSSKNFNGGVRYADWLKTLTPAERQDHLLERAQRRSNKQMMEDIKGHNAPYWVAGLNNAAVILLQKAITEGDVQAFTAVWDRIVGKPKEEIQVDAETPLPWNDDLD